MSLIGEHSLIIGEQLQVKLPSAASIASISAIIAAGSAIHSS